MSSQYTHMVRAFEKTLVVFVAAFLGVIALLVAFGADKSFLSLTTLLGQVALALAAFRLFRRG